MRTCLGGRVHQPSILKLDIMGLHVYSSTLENAWQSGLYHLIKFVPRVKRKKIYTCIMQSFDLETRIHDKCMLFKVDSS